MTRSRQTLTRREAVAGIATVPVTLAVSYPAQAYLPWILRLGGYVVRGIARFFGRSSSRALTNSARRAPKPSSALNTKALLAIAAQEVAFQIVMPADRGWAGETEIVGIRLERAEEVETFNAVSIWAVDEKNHVTVLGHNGTGSFLTDILVIEILDAITLEADASKRILLQAPPNLDFEVVTDFEDLPSGPKQVFAYLESESNSVFFDVLQSNIVVAYRDEFFTLSDLP